jgi:hypothetical protein
VLRDVPVVAPEAAAPLTLVQFCITSTPCRAATSNDTNCQIGGPCHVDIGVYWNAEIPKITYSVQFFDRCTGDTTAILAPRTDSVKGQRAWIPAPTGGFPVTLPSAKAGAIYATATVTGTSTTIQSKPYLLPGSADTC